MTKNDQAVKRLVQMYTMYTQETNVELQDKQTIYCMALTSLS